MLISASNELLPVADLHSDTRVGEVKRIRGKKLALIALVMTTRAADSHAPVDLIAKDAILRHQVFVSEAEFFVNRTGDICQHSFPIHRAKVEHGRGPSSTLRPAL